MILKEFFGKSLNPTAKVTEKNNQNISDDLFWYILDHDQLHKDYFFPIAKKIKKSGGCDADKVTEIFMPMVIKGCKEYYSKNKMTEKISKCFPKSMREEICQKLYDHYHDDILKGRYKL